METTPHQSILARLAQAVRNCGAFILTAFRPGPEHKEAWTNFTAYSIRPWHGGMYFSLYSLNHSAESTESATCQHYGYYRNLY